VLGRIRVLHARQHGLHESESILGEAFAHGLQLQHRERPASVDESVDNSAIAAAGDDKGVHRPDQRPFSIEKGSELGNAVRRQPIGEVCCQQAAWLRAENARRIAAGLKYLKIARIEGK
jgi:hypothetical protein